jgi:hypothetical protein
VAASTKYGHLRIIICIDNFRFRPSEFQLRIAVNQSLHAHPSLTNLLIAPKSPSYAIIVASVSLLVASTSLSVAAAIISATATTTIVVIESRWTTHVLVKTTRCENPRLLQSALASEKTFNSNGERVKMYSC